jgi:hypothetical protein
MKLGNTFFTFGLEPIFGPEKHSRKITPTKFVLFSNQKVRVSIKTNRNQVTSVINQAKYYAQDTSNQYSILGRLICLPGCDKTSENESGNL